MRGARGRGQRPPRRPPRGRSARRAAPTSSSARPRGAAARDHLHLQPRRLRRRRPAVPGAGLRLTTPEERDEIRRVVEERGRAHPRRGPRRARLLGVARRPGARPRRPPRRHAARPSRRSSRSSSPRGLVKAVFATETLALGINMPARSRRAREAGQVQRRDARRHHAGGVHPAHRPRRPPRHRRRGPRGRAVAAAASTRAPSPGSPRPAPTRCAPASGRPTTWPSTWSTSSAAPRAREILESSFAQFQADRAVVGLARQVRRNEEALAGYAEAMTCHLGDFAEYAALRRRDLATARRSWPGRGRPRRARRGRASAREAAPRRRHPGAGRPPRRARRRRRPGQPRRRATGRARPCSPPTGRCAG